MTFTFLNFSKLSAPLAFAPKHLQHNMLYAILHMPICTERQRKWQSLERQ